MARLCTAMLLLMLAAAARAAADPWPVAFNETGCPPVSAALVQAFTTGGASSECGESARGRARLHGAGGGAGERARAAMLRRVRAMT